MLRVIVRQARPGMTLARSVVNPQVPGQTLLAAGYRLDAYTIARLHELGAYDLWINFPGLDFLDDLFSPELSMQQQRLCETLQQSLQAQAQRADVALPVQEYRIVVEDLVQTILRSTASLPFMSVLTGVEDDLLRHSSEVCVLALMLGLRLDAYLVEQRKRHMNCRTAKEVVNLGVGCMLHDVGELQLPENLRESRHSLSLHSQTDLRWRKHTELGYNALRGQIEPSAATVILNHHQHFDGTGFPDSAGSEIPLSGSQIHVFARIAMAADTFQHLLLHDGVPLPTISALWHLQQDPLRSCIDPVVLQALLGIVTPFLPGMVVTLSDRRHAVVTKCFDGAPCYPEVQILASDSLLEAAAEGDCREVVDLSKEDKLRIQWVDGSDISAFFYGERHIATARAIQCSAQ